jgi:fatty acid desaturase
VNGRDRRRARRAMVTGMLRKIEAAGWPLDPDVWALASRYALYRVVGHDAAHALFMQSRLYDELCARARNLRNNTR